MRRLIQKQTIAGRRIQQPTKVLAEKAITIILFLLTRIDLTTTTVIKSPRDHCCNSRFTRNYRDGRNPSRKYYPIYPQG